MLIVYLNPLRKAIMTRVWGLRPSGCWLAGKAAAPVAWTGKIPVPPFSGKQAPGFSGDRSGPSAGLDFTDLADLLLVETVR
jgi:hypothetical protein